MTLLIQEKDMLLTELTLMVTAYKKESTVLNSRLERAQVERRELRSALAAARNVELGRAMARIERQLRPQTAVVTNSSSALPLWSSASTSTSTSTHGARDEDHPVIIARSAAVALPTRGDKLKKKLIRSELKKAFYSGGVESVRKMSESLSALGVDEHTAWDERRLRKRPATSGYVRGNAARLAPKYGLGGESGGGGGGYRAVGADSGQGSRRPASAAVTASPPRGGERSGNSRPRNANPASRSLESLPQRSKSANYRGRGKRGPQPRQQQRQQQQQQQQQQQRRRRQERGERPASAAPHVGPVSKMRIPSLLQGGGGTGGRIVFGNARALLNYRNAKA